MEALRPEDPRQLGPYRLRARLGEGGMGEVFLGVSPSGLRAAVKTVRPEFAHDPGFRDRFRREIAAARRVDSAWTAPIAEADPDASPPWFATEFLTGIPLNQAVAAHGPLPERAVRVLAAQLVEALMAIHRAGLVHRDLKPSNVILGRDRPRVIDFGISRAMDFATHALTSTGGTVGSPGYMSPEQASGNEVDQRSDVFSLGGVLVYAATGRPPFGGTPQNAMALLYQIIQGEPNLDAVPAGLRDLVVDCLAKDPANRPTPDEILRRSIGDADVADAAAGGAWLPPTLAAELIRRQNSDPADSLPPLPGTAAISPATLGANAGELPLTRAQYAHDAVTDVLPPPPGTRMYGDPGTSAQTHLIPGPEAAAPRRSGPSRRGFLIGGAVLGVTTIGAGTGWFLSRDSDDPAALAWSLPFGQVEQAGSLVVGDALYVVAQGADDKKSKAVGSGAVIAVNRKSGRTRWQKGTAARWVGTPLAASGGGKDKKEAKVFVLSWTDKDSSKYDARVHTLYAFDAVTGDVAWQKEFRAVTVQMPQQVTDVLCLGVGVASDRTDDQGTAKVVALDPHTGSEKWVVPLPSTHCHPTPASADPDRVLIACQPESSSDTAVVFALKPGTGDRIWAWAAPEEQWCWPVLAVPERGLAYLRSGTKSGSGYEENRTLVALRLDGPDDRRQAWRKTDLASGWGPRLEFDPGGNVVVAVTSGDDSESTVIQPWVHAFDAVSGGQRWFWNPEELQLSEPTIADSMLYVACWPSEKQSNTEQTTATSTPTATPSMPPGGYKKHGLVLAFDIPSGQERWRRELPGPGTVTTPQVVGDTVCVAVSGVGGARALAIGLNRKDGKVRWSGELTASFASGAAGADGLFHAVSAPGPEAADKTAVIAAFRTSSTQQAPGTAGRIPSGTGTPAAPTGATPTG